jgi:uncharacterized protein YecT (DUF1311 family)
VDRDRQEEIQRPTRQLNWTTIALIGGLILLLAVIAYFALGRNPDQDKLVGTEVTDAKPDQKEKLCSSKATYDLIKRELFRRAAQMRGSDQAAYDQLAAYAVVRMENAVMESEDSATGAANCSGSLSLDLPPGVAAEGGRRTLMSDVDYAVQPDGEAVDLRNADAIIAPLSRLVRVGQPPPTAPEANAAASEAGEGNVAASESANVQPGPPSAYPGRPSFDCSQARSRSEIAVCSDAGLSSLDLNMTTQYRRALASASPEERTLLEQTGARFLGYRDRCRDTQCITESYLGRMREIRDIMEDRWQPPR